MSIIMKRWRDANKPLLASIVAIASIGFTVYWNALKINFWTDDYEFLETAGRHNWLDYLVIYFDPRLQWHWYRPMQGMQWWIGYALFGTEPLGYHLIQVLLHLSNVLLLFALVIRITSRWRPAFLASLLYVTLPAYGLAVYWPGVADPLAALFFLSTIFLWIGYLKKCGSQRFVFTYLAFCMALLSKEIGAVLPVVLLLVDRWLIRKPISLFDLVRRYSLFIVALLVYALLEFNVFTRGVFTQQLGYSVGGHILEALIHHLTTLTFPWGLEPPLQFAWLLVVLMVFVYSIYRRIFPILFLSTVIVLTMLPILPFPSDIAFAPRYLYIPLMGTTVALGLLIDSVTRTLGNYRWQLVMKFVLAVTLATLIGWQSSTVAEGAEIFRSVVQVERIRFRSIFQHHSSFTPNTLLYFISPGYPNLSGLMFSRYGKNVVVKSTDTENVVELGAYNSTIVFYRDEQAEWQEQILEKHQDARLSLSLPVQFSEPLVLERLELVNDRIKRGDVLVAILSWRPQAKIDRDYTLFAHLVRTDGQIVAGTDQLLLKEDAPTSRWRVNELVAQGIVVSIGADIEPGNYTLEFGLYELATMQRLTILDANNQSITDVIAISPVRIFD